MFPKPNSKKEKARKKRIHLMSIKQLHSHIYKLDNYICQSCGDDKLLEKHHIIHRSASKKYKYEKWNIILLCKDCHHKAHNGTKYRPESIKENGDGDKKKFWSEYVSARQWMIGILEKLPDRHRCKKALLILKQKEGV